MISNKEKNFVSAVIYVHNYEKEITNMLKIVNKTLKENFNKYEIICVNDASIDNSVKEIEKFAENLENEVLSVINMSYYQGIELSMNAGVDLSIGDFVYEFDNIINENEENVIMDIYRKSLEGYDIVSASLKKNKTKSSNLFYKVFNKFSNVEYKINTEQFRILSRRAINRVNSVSSNIPYRKALYANCGLNIFNLEYEIEAKRRKFNTEVRKSRHETAINTLILFTNIGYKFSLFMSFLMIIVTILVAIYTISIFINGNPVQGWTTTMLFLSFAFFGLFSIMAIVIKYLEILIGLVFRKNKYTIESINKLN